MHKMPWRSGHHPKHPPAELNYSVPGSSPVLTATSLSYGESKNSTPTESKPLTRLR